MLAEMTLQLCHANGLHDLKMAGHRRNLKGLSGQRGPPFVSAHRTRTCSPHALAHASRDPRAGLLGARIESGQRADARLAAARISS